MSKRRVTFLLPPPSARTSMSLTRRANGRARAKAQDAFPPSSFNEPSTSSLSRQPSTLKRRPSTLKRRPSLNGKADSNGNKGNSNDDNTTNNTNAIFCKSDSMDSLIGGSLTRKTSVSFSRYDSLGRKTKLFEAAKGSLSRKPSFNNNTSGASHSRQASLTTPEQSRLGESFIDMSEPSHPRQPSLNTTTAAGPSLARRPSLLRRLVTAAKASPSAAQLDLGENVHVTITVSSPAAPEEHGTLKQVDLPPLVSYIDFTGSVRSTRSSFRSAWYEDTAAADEPEPSEPLTVEPLCTRHMLGILTKPKELTYEDAAVFITAFFNNEIESFHSMAMSLSYQPSRVGADQRLRIRILLGIDRRQPWQVSVPAPYWSNKDMFMHAAHLLSQCVSMGTRCTPTEAWHGVVNRTSELRADLFDEGAFVGWLPLDMGYYTAAQSMERIEAVLVMHFDTVEMSGGLFGPHDAFYYDEYDSRKISALKESDGHDVVYTSQVRHVL